MRLFPRIISFSLNAYLDAQICEELVTYIKTKGKSFATRGTTSQLRAKKLVSVAKGKKIDYLIGLAYTEYYVNGLADILYAKILFKLLVSSNKSELNKIYSDSIKRFSSNLTTNYQFEEFVGHKALYFKYWFSILADPWRWSQTFAKNRCGYNGKLDRDLLRQATIEVQRQNVANNYKVADNLRRGVFDKDIKALELKRLAKEHRNESYLTGAIKTQQAAARWDKFFVRLISR